jgi:hypothetical protein
MTDRIAIAEITVDRSLQLREAMDHAAIDEYAAAIGRGDPFPPITLFRVGDELVVVDGFHRLVAYSKAGLDKLPATVFEGDYKAALAFAIAANCKHGMRPKPGDLARAYRAAVEHGLCPATDIAAVESLLHCSPASAKELTRPAREAEKQARIEQAKALQTEGKTQREIADVIGVTHQTVGNWLGKFGQTSEICQDADPATQPFTPDQPPTTDPPYIPGKALKEALDELAAVKAHGKALKAQHRIDVMTSPFLRAQDFGIRVAIDLGSLVERIERFRDPEYPVMIHFEQLMEMEQHIHRLTAIIEEQKHANQRNSPAVRLPLSARKH